jgi:hypothetical protein
LELRSIGSRAQRLADLAYTRVRIAFGQQHRRA